MAKQYIQEKIYGNPGQMVTINRSNIISNSIYKPTNKVIKVNGPANANIYAAYITDNTDIPYPDIKGILVYDHIFTYTSNNNVSITNFNLDTWMSSTYGSIYTTTFTYVSSHSGNKWRVNNTSTYVNINNLGISYTMTSGSAPQNGTVVNITADYSKSRYEIWVPSIGNWNVVCVGAAGYSENKIEIISNTNVYYMDVAIFQAFISVNYTRGAECTITNIENNLTLTADNTEGYYTFTVPYTGIWRIRVEQTFGTGNNAYVKTKYDSVLVSNLNQQITRTVELISNNLEECTWAEIKYVADQHMGDKYWQIGDCKAVYISPNGTFGNVYTGYLVNELYYVFIIGFDHNSTVEGSGITFQFGKFKKDSPYDVCIGEGIKFPNNVQGALHSYGTYMNHYYMGYNGNTSDSSGMGWSTSTMRTRTLCQDISNPTSGSLMEALPEDLRAVMKSVTKWTDNVGGTSLTSAANVTSTTDYLFLLAQYEMFGTTQIGSSTTHCNANEANKQQQYAYYANRDQTVADFGKYRYNSKENNPNTDGYTGHGTYLRSPVNQIYSGYGQYYAGTQYSYNSTYGWNGILFGYYFSNTDTYAFAPAFVVGSEDE